MKKTVVFEFKDDFKFPEKYSCGNCTGCPFDTIAGDDEPTCFLTGDCEIGKEEWDKERGRFIYLPHPQCPFYGGADHVSYNDC